MGRCWEAREGRLVTWAGLHEAGLAAEPVRRAAAPGQGRSQQLPALEGEAQATAMAAAAPARPGRQATVYCGDGWARFRGGLTRERAFPGEPPNPGRPNPAPTTAVLVRAVLAVRLQVAAPLGGQTLPTAAGQLARRAEAPGGRQPRQGGGGHGEGHGARCPCWGWGRAREPHR